MKITLRAARVNAGLTQDDVAKAIKKSKATIVHWEKGKTYIDEANFNFLCRLYGAETDDIFLPYESTNRRLPKDSV